MIVYETYAWSSCPECICGSTRAGRTYIFSSVMKAQQFWEEYVPGLKWERLITCYVARGENYTVPESRSKNPNSHANHVHKRGFNILDHEVK